MFCCISVSISKRTMENISMSWLFADLHLVDPKPRTCFDTYTENEPIYLSKIVKTCVKQLPKHNNCLGLETKNGETIILECRGQRSIHQKGCYRIIDGRHKEGVVCQKLVRKRGCEIIQTPSLLNIEVYCYAFQATPASIIMVRDNKPRRE